MDKLCLGKCGRIGKYTMKNGNTWCSKYPSLNCPVISKKRARSISRTKLKLSKLGLNPMQNPLICKKNHSPQRNKNASKTLKELGKLGLLPQQKESAYLKNKRRKNVSRTLRKMFSEGVHPRQLESLEERKKRLEKMAGTLKRLGKQGKLPIQNMSPKEKKRFSKKISKVLRYKIRRGLIKLYTAYGKRIPYKSVTAGDLILRSYWEVEIAKILDSLDVNWSYEPLVIDYWDSQRKVVANTIPDFYIPQSNLIIEVKGSGFDSIKTTDKMKGIKKAGYNTLLIGRKELKKIRENSFQLRELIKGDMIA